MEFVTGKQNEPWSVFLYGVAGVGKTELSMLAPGAFGVNVEGGMNHVTAPRTKKKLNTYAEVRQAVAAATEQPNCQTVVIDSYSRVEDYLLSEMLQEEGKDSIADWDFGGGHFMLEARCIKFLQMLSWVHAQGKNIIVIGHDDVQRFEDPATDSYDRYVPKAHKKCLPHLKEFFDAVFYMRYEVNTTAQKGTKTKDKKRGISSGKRIIQTKETAAWLAKNRFSLPDVLDASPEVWSMLTFNGGN